MLLHPLTPLSPSVSWMLDAELGVGVRHLALKNSDARRAASLPRGTRKKITAVYKSPRRAWQKRRQNGEAVWLLGPPTHSELQGILWDSRGLASVLKQTECWAQAREILPALLQTALPHPEQAQQLCRDSTNPVAAWLPQTPVHILLGCTTHHIHVPVPGEFALMTDSREFGKDSCRELGPSQSLRVRPNNQAREDIKASRAPCCVCIRPGSSVGGPKTEPPQRSRFKSTSVNYQPFVMLLFSH